MTQATLADHVPEQIIRPLLFEVWSTTPEEQERQIALVLGRSSAAKKRPRRRAKRPKPREVGEGAIFWEREPWQQAFVDTLPAYPNCAGMDFRHGIFKRSRDLALNYPHIQPNMPMRRVWLVFDIDREDGGQPHERAKLPPPNIVMVKPENAHSHLGYRLRAPVMFYARSRPASIDYLAEIERAMVRRLDADKAFAGHLIKNPLSENWNTSHPRDEPYTLSELAGYLDKREMRPWTKGELETGLGRNVSLFNALRQVAYREVRTFKRNGGDFPGFRTRLHDVAGGLNVTSGFAGPLDLSEISGIVRSVAKWTWGHFSEEQFSELQRWRGSRGNANRWAEHTTAAERAAAAGVSRATWYRQRIAGGTETAKPQVRRSPYQDKGGCGANAAPLHSYRHWQAFEASDARQDRAEQIAPFTLRPARACERSAA
jgi:hypothetical protein